MNVVIVKMIQTLYYENLQQKLDRYHKNCILYGVCDFYTRKVAYCV